MNAFDATEQASAILATEPPPEGTRDPRWQALLVVTSYIQHEPELVWEFIEEWGGHEREDIREAVATCLLEPLLERHCEDFLTLIAERAISDTFFADMFLRCERFGSAAEPPFAKRFDALRRQLTEKFFD